MKRSEILFERPAHLNATRRPQARGLARDAVRLLVSTPDGHAHARFRDLPDFLEPGDLLVVNRSATLPASLPASGAMGAFVLNLSTDYGRNLWLAEPRRSISDPGPLPLSVGDEIDVAGVRARLVAPYPRLARLWFVQFESGLETILACCGRPIQYGYLEDRYALSTYQTIFADTPGSVEMPSAAYPFTRRVLDGLQVKGVHIADITLHTGVSSLEVETDTVEDHPLYAEPFWVPEATAAAVNAAKRDGRRVIAVGTTAVRALESAWNGTQVEARSGFTRVYIHPTRGIHVVDGLISGLHDSGTSHLAMLYAIAGKEAVDAAYAEAIQQGYLWHEFGDSHLILTREPAATQRVRLFAGTINPHFATPHI